MKRKAMGGEERAIGPKRVDWVSLKCGFCQASFAMYVLGQCS